VKKLSEVLPTVPIEDGQAEKKTLSDMLRPEFIANMAKIEKEAERVQYVLSGDDITYMHSVMVQCFLPHQRLKNGALSYQVNHGRAALVVNAGKLVIPGKRYQFEQREVPAGAKARLILAYINNEAMRTRNTTIDMGRSLREFMHKNQVPVSGQNAREITNQVKNLAAAEMVLGIWEKTRATTATTRVAKALSFWLEKDDKQGTLWTPEMTLSDDYVKTLLQRPMPINFRALVALQGSPRAMDLYCWLTYRLPAIKKHGVPVKIAWQDLIPIFGGALHDMKNFKAKMRRSLVEVLQYYPEARVSFEPDHLVLRKSVPAIVRKDATRDLWR